MKYSSFIYKMDHYFSGIQFLSLLNLLLKPNKWRHLLSTLALLAAAATPFGGFYKFGLPARESRFLSPK